MANLITTYEASSKYCLTGSYFRRLMREGKLKGREADVTASRTMWLIDEDSIKKYLANAPKPGRPVRQKKD